MNKNNILLLFAHPCKHRSEANIPLFNFAQTLDYVTCVDLYAEYPRFNIDIDKEQQRLKQHDIVIFQFPFYWYSTPSLLKEWQDLVLEYGFAYGRQGIALKGKTFMCALTAGGMEAAYHAKGYNHFTVRELLQPLEQTANLTGMNYLPPFARFSSRSAHSTLENEQHQKQWAILLERLHLNEIELESTKDLITINQLLTKTTTNHLTQDS